ncbi:hypothetical protein F2Q68_00024230 [Brassica cretica]|uniref:Uncharacterized protein n=1 Tax=Brassica cretica TaxID=69181 RepID=A0A8S9IJJ0_BRACR|nr:hypothetical protein F2Q68_00024230 [Brassica cretica]
MARPQLPNLLDEIMSKIIGLVGEDSALYLGAFMRAGIRGYELCVNVGNIVAVYYEGLHRSTTLGVEEGINVLERNVPTHVLSTLAVGIFYMCLGKEMEAITVFQRLAGNDVELKSEAIF